MGTILGKFGWGVIYHQPGIILALLFVTYPFVIRSVQPVLLELDKAEEEAAWTLGAGPLDDLSAASPSRRFEPAILTGSALAFSRALGEFGSVVLVAGNRPMETKTAPLYIFGEIEGGNRHGAMVVSIVLLAASLAILVVLNLSFSAGREVPMATEVLQPDVRAIARRGVVLRRDASHWAAGCLIASSWGSSRC